MQIVFYFHAQTSNFEVPCGALESMIPNILHILKPPDDQRLLLEKVRSIGPRCDPNQSGVNAAEQPTPSIAAIQNREEGDPVP
jgi:hypothetical protein